MYIYIYTYTCVTMNVLPFGLCIYRGVPCRGIMRKHAMTARLRWEEITFFHAFFIAEDGCSTWKKLKCVKTMHTHTHTNTHTSMHIHTHTHTHMYTHTPFKSHTYTKKEDIPADSHSRWRVMSMLTLKDLKILTKFLLLETLKLFALHT